MWVQKLLEKKQPAAAISVFSRYGVHTDMSVVNVLKTVAKDVFCWQSDPADEPSGVSRMDEEAIENVKEAFHKLVEAVGGEHSDPTVMRYYNIAHYMTIRVMYFTLSLSIDID